MLMHGARQNIRQRKVCLIRILRDQSFMKFLSERNHEWAGGEGEEVRETCEDRRREGKEEDGNHEELEKISAIQSGQRDCFA